MRERNRKKGNDREKIRKREGEEGVPRWKGSERLKENMKIVEEER